jgi:hypothetical protein
MVASLARPASSERSPRAPAAPPNFADRTKNSNRKWSVKGGLGDSSNEVERRCTSAAAGGATSV